MLRTELSHLSCIQLAAALPDQHVTMAPLIGTDNHDKFPDEYMVSFHEDHALDRDQRTLPFFTDKVLIVECCESQYLVGEDVGA